MQSFTTCLWFDNNGQEAVNFYKSIFKETKVLSTARYPENSPGPAGQVMSVEFEMNGQKFLALNGGPHFKFNEAISIVINCDTQEEIDYYWKALTADGGQESQCGWLKDKFGLSWQVNPTIMNELFTSGDEEKSERVMQAMLKMKKFDINVILDAAKGK